MSLMNRITRRTDRGFHSLRDAIASSRNCEDLSKLPERFARVIERFDALDVDPTFRQDVYHVLNGAVDLAQSMVDQTYPVEYVGQALAQQMQVFARIMLHLQSTPTTQGYAILLPERRQLVGHFTTQSEAQTTLQRYRALGISPNCVVVPTAVRSLHAIQPREREQTVAPRPDLAPAQPLLGHPYIEDPGVDDDLMAPLPLEQPQAQEIPATASQGATNELFARIKESEAQETPFPFPNVARGVPK